MNTTHVFIVDTTTFKYHLEYLFAGTGAKDHKIDFNNKPTSSLHSTIERMLVSMMSDSQRVREGDYVLFYLQQEFSKKVTDGKFFGIFKVKQAPSFLDHNNSNQFLKPHLKKSLTFRTLIEPFEVYANGVTEWEALDEIKHIQSPFQMLWSLIYRKLKGNRGNTMITIYESERLFKLIRDKNNRKHLSGPYYTFDVKKQEIESINTNHSYTGKQEQVDIYPRLRQKYIENKAFESHLQTYIIQNIGRGTNQSLDTCLLNHLNLDWIGNEVSCGVGMQKIDILLEALEGIIRVLISIELKATEANPSNILQIQRYVDWLEQYYFPNRIGDLQPVLVTLPPSSRTSPSYIQLIHSLKKFNKDYPQCRPVKYVEYLIERGTITFNLIAY